MVYGGHFAREPRDSEQRIGGKNFFMVFSAPLLLSDGKVRQSRIHKHNQTIEVEWPSLPGSTQKTTFKPETKPNTFNILAADWKTHIHNAQILRLVAEEEAWNAQVLAMQATSMLMTMAIECAYSHE
jgi:hypothetical protein